ncbi:MAG: ATP-binding protein [Verrucomicrobiae bacterium]|nr:ATP-binding protein [Verrucomicrobiae bacterium]
MFGKDQAIRDPEAAPNFFVDYRERLDPSNRWTDRIYPDGTWESNLFQFYQRVWPKLSSGLPVPFHLEGAMRRDETSVHEALREAFVNALIHADYSAPGGVVVERLPDQFVMENPGTLLVSLEQFRRGGVSECRNKALQQMFLMVGGGERAGSGVDKIRQGWRSQHWRAPLIAQQLQPERVRLKLPMISLIPEEALEKLRAYFGESFKGVSKEEVQAMATALLEGDVSNVRLQELLSNHPVDISRMLQGLCDRGLLVSDQKRRWTRYRLPSQALKPMPLFDRGDMVGQAPEDSSHLDGDSSHLDGDSSRLADSSKIITSLTSKEDEALKQIAREVAGKGKISQEQTRKVLVRLCQGRMLTLEQIARLLERNPQAIRNRFLTPMVREGLLRLRFPDAPNRPDQAYTSTTQPMQKNEDPI